MSRKLLESRLEKLSFTPTPLFLNNGAMCYDIAYNINRIEFVCPVCGEKTIYSENAPPAIRKFAATRRVFKKLKFNDLGMRLDEREFCKKCSPSVKEPKLFLVINYSDAPPSRVQLSSPDDLIILKDFLEGKTVYKNAQAKETPLKKYLPRIKELLGVK